MDLNDRKYRRKGGEGIDYMEVLKPLTARFGMSKIVGKKIVKYKKRSFISVPV